MSHKKAVGIVEGNIASGKSTLSDQLAEALGKDTLVLKEPADQKDNMNPFLDLYYEDPRRWAFTTQVHLLQARYRMHLQAQWHAMNGAGHAILDRSFYGDTAFANVQWELDSINLKEFESYASIYEAMTASVLFPTFCIRLLVTPEICLERVEKRKRDNPGRHCEESITLDYLQRLDRAIDHMVRVLNQQGVIIIDMPWDVDRSTPESRQSAIDALAERIKSMKPLNWFLDKHRRII
jgi:deoxyadenosine/deoxycytidine kinase